MADIGGGQVFIYPVKDVRKKTKHHSSLSPVFRKGKGKSLKEEGGNFRVTGSQARPVGFLSQSAVPTKGPQRMMMSLCGLVSGNSDFQNRRTC